MRSTSPSLYVGSKHCCIPFRTQHGVQSLDNRGCFVNGNPLVERRTIAAQRRLKDVVRCSRSYKVRSVAPRSDLREANDMKQLDLADFSEGVKNPCGDVRLLFRMRPCHVIEGLLCPRQEIQALTDMNNRRPRLQSKIGGDSKV